VLRIRVAELLLRAPRLGPQPDRGGLADAERKLRERRPAQQVVVIGVRREQRRHPESRLPEQRRQRVELVGEVRRVDQHRLVTGADCRARGLPHPAGHDDGVRVDGYCAHGAKASRRSLRPSCRRPQATIRRKSGLEELR
jgi:hypothetical protein